MFMSASATTIWDLVSDVTNTGRFSPETFDAEWLDGVGEPAVGARFRGHVKRNEIGPVYWTTCRVTHCERGQEFGFEVLVGSAAVNNWHYRFVAQDDGTVVTESFWTPEPLLLRPFTFLGEPRRRRNIRDMARTLERIKAEGENR
jgi:polyketide cyclase/dehydrase/lipid transport protein